MFVFVVDLCYGNKYIHSMDVVVLFTYFLYKIYNWLLARLGNFELNTLKFFSTNNFGDICLEIFLQWRGFSSKWTQTVATLSKPFFKILKFLKKLL